MSPCRGARKGGKGGRGAGQAKHLRDFKKYNPKSSDRPLEDPTKPHMWLASVETIFRYIKCPINQKVQCAVFFFMDRGTAWWETTERMLGGDQEFLNLEQDNMTVYLYDSEFSMLSHFAPEVIANEATRIDMFVSVDMSLHERVDPSKAAGIGLTLGGVFQRHCQEIAAAGKTLKELPAYHSCGRSHGGRCLGSGCSFGFTEDQFCLGVPLGLSKTRDVLTGSLDYVCLGTRQFKGIGRGKPTNCKM
ncbi:gag-protease polyprotein [Cucumis melo var. makuwa]|uniref:Gag-protease polyprotein n=1 Tax=Cucumis melo var. makuwa TaxID=1194695 RepID=A0A5A7T6Y6_CUCMM|nr:gag-protease polyprotein [Cucumis melo var. makuwa]TYJ97556.1 gag-protease polyprotein [Cucumis melo var. makuwa]